MKGRGGAIRRWAAAASATLTLGLLTVSGATPATTSALGAIRPAVTNDFAFIAPGQTPPTEDQCYTAIPVARRCFAPEAMRNSYNLGPLYDQGFDGTGFTIAVVDSFGSSTIANDLNVFNTEFGLPHLCGEPNVTCTPGMPSLTFFKANGPKPKGT